eukprot:UN30702
MYARYPTQEELDDAFEIVVLRRIRPSLRDEYREKDFTFKIKQLFHYEEVIERKTFQTYIESLEHEEDLIENLALLRGAIIDKDAEWVQTFVEELGLQRIIQVVERQRENEDIWEVYHCALECFEAVIENFQSEDYASGIDQVIDNFDVLFMILSCLDHPESFVRVKVINIMVILFIHTDSEDMRESFDKIAEANR